MIGIDLFAGAGGMSLGAKLAGIKVSVAIEQDVHAVNTYSMNHPECKILSTDIRNVPDDQIARIPKGHNETVVFGGPPCQGFSYSNTRTRTLENPNNWLFQEFVRFVQIWQPDFFVFENVRGITNTSGGAFLVSVCEQFARLEYRLCHGVLNAKDFGVPQDRARFFLLGSRRQLAMSLPEPYIAPPPTVNEAIGDLPILPNGASCNWLTYERVRPSTYACQLRGKSKSCPNHLVTRNADYIIHRYEYIPPGGNWENIPVKLMKNYADSSRCHTRIYHRLRPECPSVVIGNFRKNMLIHPNQNRGLSVREAARIQSFQDTYEFTGTIGFQQQQVGNAVPPLLAKAVFSSLLQQANR